MAEFVVNTNQLRSCANQLSGLQNQLDSVAIRLGALQLGSVLRINASTALIGRVGDCKWAASHQSDNLGKLARALDDISGLYDRYERELCQPQTAEQAEAEHANDIDFQVPGWAEIMEDWLPPIFDIGGVVWEGLQNMVFDLSDWVGTGINHTIATIGAAIGSFANNFVEFEGDLLSAGFISEFIGQTLVDASIGIGAGAAATMIATAILGTTPVGWAAVAVAGVATVAVWGANAFCEWITEGDSISEVAMDFARESHEWINDRIDDVVDGVREGAEAIGDFVGEAANSICDGAQALWSGFTGLFS